MYGRNHGRLCDRRRRWWRRGCRRLCLGRREPRSQTRSASFRDFGLWRDRPFHTGCSRRFGRCQRSIGWGRSMRCSSRTDGRNRLYVRRWSDSRRVSRGRSCGQREKTSLQKLKVVLQSRDLLFQPGCIATPTAFDDAGIDQRRQTHQQPGDEKQQYISHSYF